MKAANTHALEIAIETMEIFSNLITEEQTLVDDDLGIVASTAIHKLADKFKEETKEFNCDIKHYLELCINSLKSSQNTEHLHL
jgi:hypothetical protein